MVLCINIQHDIYSFEQYDKVCTYFLDDFKKSQNLTELLECEYAVDTEQEWPVYSDNDGTAESVY